MLVKDVIIAALRLVGRGDVAEALSAGETLSDSDGETVNTLLYCFNAVEDEVARCYLPLKHRETLDFSGGDVYYSSFERAPVKILKVTGKGRSVRYELFPQYMRADCGLAEVEYYYSPAKKQLDGVSDFAAGAAGENLFACGAASEYCLLNGEIEAAELWESRYREEIDAAHRRALPQGRIPLRRWV